MAKCPLCASRSAKRRCPAKQADICAVCCATKREVEIDCPSDCRYLRQGQDYAASTARKDGPVPRREFSAQFRRKNALLITAFVEAIARERLADPSLLDQDVHAAFEALKATVRTLDSGIYYETEPETPGAVRLYRRVRGAVDEMAHPSGAPGVPALRISDAPDVIDFVLVSVELHSGGRPKSRRFLDWLCSSLPQGDDAGPFSSGSSADAGAERSGDGGSGLIVP